MHLRKRRQYEKNYLEGKDLGLGVLLPPDRDPTLNSVSISIPPVNMELTLDTHSGNQPHVPLANGRGGGAGQNLFMMTREQEGPSYL